MYKKNMVSIIIPIYNAKKWIKDTIENILNQTYDNFELILVDDCSKDGTRKILKQYENKNNIKIIYLAKNRGPGIARNIGLKSARGRYICFQDADDLWDKDKLKKQLAFMKKKGCAFSYTGFKYIKENNKLKTVHIPEKLNYKEALKDIRILTNSVMFDLEKIDIRLLQMKNINAEDIETWYKILKEGYTAYGIDEPLTFYRLRKDSRSGNKLKSAKDRWNIYKKEEDLNILKSSYYFVNYVLNSIRKRIF